MSEMRQASIYSFTAVSLCQWEEIFSDKPKIWGGQESCDAKP